jgi:ankyrin repeat protein
MLLFALLVGDAFVVNAADRNKRLWEAANTCKDDQVEALLAEGADPNVIRDGLSPLMLAAFSGRVRMVQALLKAGAKPNTANKNGLTSLHYAVLRNHQGDVVSSLLGAGAFVDAIAKQGMTPLLFAVLNGGTETVKILLEAGANVELAETTRGSRPLMFAAQSGSHKIVRALLEKGAQVNAANKDGGTALMFATGRGRVEAARVLLEHGADPDMQDKAGNTATSIAAIAQKSGVAHLLKEFKSGGLEAIRLGAADLKPLMRINDIDVWLEIPKRSHLSLNDLRAEEKVRVPASGTEPNQREATDEETLYTLAARYLVTDAKKMNADAIVIRSAVTDNQSVSKSTPSFGQSILLGIVAGLGGGSAVVLPGRNYFVEKTHTVMATAIRYVPELPVVAPGQAGDALMQADIAFWNSVKDAKESASVQLYLDKFPNGHFAELARMKLKVIKEREERERSPAIFYVYRIPNTPGKPSLFIDGIEVARLLGGRYLKLVVQPGEKLVVVDNRNRPGIMINVIGGETYYLRANWGFRKDQYIELVDELRGRGELAPMKPLTLEPKWLRDTTMLHKDQALP